MQRATKTLVCALLVTTACAPAAAPAPAPVAPTAAAEPTPAVDPQVFDQNKKDIEELAKLLLQFEPIAKSATQGTADVQAAVASLTKVAEEKKIKKENLDKLVEKSLAANKPETKGVKKADRDAVSAALQGLLDKVSTLKATKGAVSSSRAQIDTLKQQATTLADAIKQRTNAVLPNAKGDDEALAKAHLQHVDNVLAAVEGNVKAAHSMLDGVQATAETLAQGLNLKLDDGAAAAPAAAPATK